MLDFTGLAQRLEEYAADRATAALHLAAARGEAERRLREPRRPWAETAQRVRAARTSWLLADLPEDPAARCAAPPLPLPHAVGAADGSQIVASRHDPAPCSLINIGAVSLRYAAPDQPDPPSKALLNAQAHILPPPGWDAEMLASEDGGVSERRLGACRLLEEIAAAVEAAAAHRPLPALALVDGTLILWAIETDAVEFRVECLRKLQAALERAQSVRLPVAGYISDPGSRDVVNALRVAVCPHPEANCDRYCPHRRAAGEQRQDPGCAGTERVTDADLFRSWLAPGERSALFGCRSKIVGDYREDDRIRFFYLRPFEQPGVSDEVARIEIPAWVAEDDQLVGLVHALALDQAAKGGGYPVALAESHELAIVRAPEREYFFQLLETRFVRSGTPWRASQKLMAKRARRI